MKANFDESLARVLVHEGGWADLPKDPGGATMKGVTLRTYQRFYGSHLTRADLHAISDERLARIYRTGFWDTINGDTLPIGLDYAAFDAAVNSGPARALSWLSGHRAEAAVSLRIVDLCASRLRFLHGLSTWPTFGAGWARRVDDVRDAALRQAGRAERPELAPVPALPTLRVGDAGAAVRALQGGLGMDPDGAFGPSTYDALMHYQRERGLHVDGVAGRQVWRALGLQG
ncbi:glycosyl hydrolase 108 family protein [uncultured Thiodictyon sp.]|uniref:glycosyl hydrolase 108 family protein n=1 Tax=uncultured Thiodictyon sp. TaxID=1846217 RepID=UPI0025F03A9B|nr:glycosyl hydrolase 108 family protein [uncultured Thiodictyon sp.]